MPLEGPAPGCSCSWMLWSLNSYSCNLSLRVEGGFLPARGWGTLEVSPRVAWLWCLSRWSPPGGDYEGENPINFPVVYPPGYLRRWPTLPVLDPRVLGMGGRAGCLWPRAGLDPGYLQPHVILDRQPVGFLGVLLLGGGGAPDIDWICLLLEALAPGSSGSWVLLLL